MNLVFFGTTDTGWHCLHEIIKAGVPVKGIVTGLPEFEISYAKDKVQNLRHRSFKNFQEERGIPVLTFTRRFDDEIVQVLTSWQPQLFVVIGWYHLIPAHVRALAPLGTVGVHWSLLPKYRGGSPLVWAIINGERETGASLFYLESKVDTGDLIAQERVRIGADEEVGEVIAKLNTVSGKLAAEHIPKLLHGAAARWAQDEAHATYFPPRAPEDGKIDWTWPARRIYDFIRAQTLPYPCAFSFYRGCKIKIVKAALQPVTGVRVRAGDGAWLGLEKILLEGEREVKWARDYFQREEIDLGAHV